MSMGEINIEGLYQIKPDRYQEMIDLYIDVFRDYPKLVGVFPNEEDRVAAIKMVINFYVAYDFCHGKAYCLDENMNESIVLTHSDVMDYSDERIAKANCENEQFLAAMSQLSQENVQKWWDFFDMFEELEDTVDIPRPHIYIDFLAVKRNLQRQGIGTELMKKVIAYADSVNLPIMLFTNTEHGVRFYKSLGFKVIGITEAPEINLKNTYLLYEKDLVRITCT